MRIVRLTGGTKAYGEHRGGFEKLDTVSIRPFDDYCNSIPIHTPVSGDGRQAVWKRSVSKTDAW